MTEFKGTPFPWVKKRIGDRQVIISDGSLINNEDGSTTYQPVVDVKYINNDDDARLIEAAPLLLEALQALFYDYKALADSGDAGNWSLEDQKSGKQALAAINAALGVEDADAGV